MNKGYIEGYFGRLLSWRERHSMVAAMDADGLDTWVYAPKEEPRHRRQWRQPWGQDWLRELAAFRAAASEMGVVNLVVALSPGLDMDFDTGADLDALCAKYEAALEAGATAVGLFFDDIPLPPGDASAEDARRQAQAATQVVARLGIAGEQLWFCPTQYCTSFVQAAGAIQAAGAVQGAAGGTAVATQNAAAAAGAAEASSPYLVALRQCLPAGTRVLWTGPQVISPTLREADVAGIRSLFGDDLRLWDNFYANDYAPRRVLVCPYSNRDRDLPLLLNPTGLPCTDALYMRLLGRHAAGQDGEEALAQVLAAAGVPEVFAQVAPLFGLPRVEGAAAEADADLLALWRRQYGVLRQLAFGDWSSPLQREWFAFLQGMAGDLNLSIRLAEGGDLASALRRLTAPLQRLVAPRRGS